MAKHAMSWARTRGLVRTNEVHGKEEFRILSFEGFRHSNIDSSVQEVTTQATLQDRSGALYMCSCIQDAGGLFTGPGAEITLANAQTWLGCLRTGGACEDGRYNKPRSCGREAPGQR